MLGMAGLGKLITNVADALLNRLPRQAAIAFIEGMRKDVREAFAKGIDPVTQTPWPPIKYRTGQLLVLTGSMRKAAESAVDAAQPSGWGVSIHLITPAYAKYHQTGTRKMPRRRFFGISPTTKTAASKSYSGEVVKLMVG